MHSTGTSALYSRKHEARSKDEAEGEGFCVQCRDGGSAGGWGYIQQHSRSHAAHESACGFVCASAQQKNESGVPCEPGPSASEWMEVRKQKAAEGERARATVIETVQSAA